LAQQTDDSGSKALYVQMAQAWIKLAGDIETRRADDAVSATPPEIYNRH
jgi:hypothetical protein